MSQHCPDDFLAPPGDEHCLRAVCCGGAEAACHDLPLEDPCVSLCPSRPSVWADLHCWVREIKQTHWICRPVPSCLFGKAADPCQVVGSAVPRVPSVCWYPRQHRHALSGRQSVEDGFEDIPIGFCFDVWSEVHALPPF
eukprot:100052-Rhodomonas_salina.1